MDIIFSLRYYYCCCFNSQYSLNYIFTLSDALNCFLQFYGQLTFPDTRLQMRALGNLGNTLFAILLFTASAFQKHCSLWVAEFTHTSILCSFPSLWTFHQHACSSQNQKSSLVLECMALAIYFKGNTSNIWDSWECLCPELLEIWYCSQDFVP